MKKYNTVSQRSICSGSSTPSSNVTRESSKVQQTGLSVVKITFPETKRPTIKKINKM